MRVQLRYKHMHRIGLWAAIRSMSTSITTLRQCTNASTVNFTRMRWMLIRGTAVGWYTELILRFYRVVLFLFLFYSWSGVDTEDYSVSTLQSLWVGTRHWDPHYHIQCSHIRSYCVSLSSYFTSLSSYFVSLSSYFLFLLRYCVPN